MALVILLHMLYVIPQHSKIWLLCRHLGVGKTTVGTGISVPILTSTSGHQLLLATGSRLIGDIAYQAGSNAGLIIRRDAEFLVPQFFF